MGSYVVSILTTRLSSFQLLLGLIPFSAIVLSLPALMPMFPHMWAAAAVGAMLGLSMIVMPPLQALVSELAPEGRASEALGAVGAFKSLSSLLGNFCVSAVVPALYYT